MVLIRGAITEHFWGKGHKKGCCGGNLERNHRIFTSVISWGGEIKPVFMKNYFQCIDKIIAIRMTSSLSLGYLN